MKSLIVFSLLAVAFVFIGCNKAHNSNIEKQSFVFTGKWNYSQRSYSPGGPLIYESTRSLNQWIIFRKDSSISSNMPRFQKFSSYSLTDSVTIQFSGITQSDELYFFHFDPETGKLSLSSAITVCIEGCADIFTKL